MPVILVNGKLLDPTLGEDSQEGKEYFKKKEKKRSLVFQYQKTLKSVTTLIGMQMFPLPLSPFKTLNIAYSALQ